MKYLNVNEKYKKWTPHDVLIQHSINVTRYMYLEAYRNALFINVGFLFSKPEITMWTEGRCSWK